jgi:[ribosomal protein S5]-alanine N-acetyltransferase
MQTDRLILREPEDADVDILREYHRRNEGRFAPWEPLHSDDPEHHRQWIAAARGERWSGRPATLLAFDRRTATLVGVVSLSGFSRGDAPSAMISYTVDGAYEGRGFATEAVRCVIEYARADLALRSLSAFYHPGNVRSGRLLERLGFTKVFDAPVIPGFERLMRAQVTAVLEL